MIPTLRDAAQALYAYCLEELPCGTSGDPQRADKLLTDMRAALSAPQPAADERVAEHMRAVAEYKRIALLHQSEHGQMIQEYQRQKVDAWAAVESSARALLAAGLGDAGAVKPERVRHVVSGRLYDLIGDATVQSDSPLTDMTQVRLYRGDDGKYWVRPIREFGARFVAAEPGPVAAMQKGTP